MSLPRSARLRRLAAPILVAAAGALAGEAPAGAQGKTTTTLIQRGGALFEDQQYEESLQTLSAALLRPGSSDAEKIETYRLLAYNYIILKRTEEADAAVRGLLVLDESFSLPPTESPRFRDFFDSTRKKWADEGKPGKAAVGLPVAQEKPIRMEHASPAQTPAGATFKLVGSVSDPDARVRGVQLAYRTGSTGKFITVTGTYSLGQFRTQIPGTAVKPPLIEYYLQAVDKSGLPLTSRGDAAAPLRVVVPGGGVLTSPFFWVPVGATVVGGAVLAAFLLTSSSNNTKSTAAVTIGVKE